MTPSVFVIIVLGGMLTMTVIVVGVCLAIGRAWERQDQRSTIPIVSCWECVWCGKQASSPPKRCPGCDGNCYVPVQFTS